MTFDALAPAIAWPLMLLTAWVAGEWTHTRLHLPRICAYAAVGMVLGAMDLARLTTPHGSMAAIAQLALALVMFELGYRINPRWFRHNPWLLVSGVVASVLTYAAVWWVTGLLPAWGWAALSQPNRLVIAALCVATSPPAVMRVTQELGACGQVTERLLHLCAIHCMLAVLLLHLTMGYVRLEASGEWGHALLGSVYVIALSLAAGAALGLAVPRLTAVATSSEGITVVFALLVLLLAGVAFALQWSPLLAALAFGAMARERRVMLSPAQRNFGIAGELLTVYLFVFIGALLSWQTLAASFALGAVLLAVRSTAQVAANVAVARISGTTFEKGALTGAALMPMSAFAMLLLEQSERHGDALAAESMAAMTGLFVLLELLGPVAMQRALVRADETAEQL
jgi:Kef-type K+ transport system membrane component KefB